MNSRHVATIFHDRAEIATDKEALVLAGSLWLPQAREGSKMITNHVKGSP